MSEQLIEFNKPTISVVVPVYNVKDYLQKCIQSLINQTYENIEILLVDDGSTDGCGEICDSFCEEDDRIITLHKKNGGLSDARNYGIDRASGDLLGFVDGDDWIHPQMYEIMVHRMNVTNSDMITCWFTQEKEDDFMKTIPLDGVKSKTITPEEALSDIETPLVVAWNKLYKRILFDDIRYPIGKLHEDEFVIHRLFKLCNSITVVSNPLYFYTLRDSSIVSNMSIKRINDALEAFMDRVEYVKDVQWSEVLPAVVMRYCDYCIDRYYDIETGRYQLGEEIKHMLWECERDMVRDNPNVVIKKKYRRFADDPSIYENWERLLQNKLRIRKCILLIKERLRRKKK